MPLHFPPEEFTRRKDATVRAMGDRGMEGLLIFRQESMYYLTGYDTFGYVYFQCLYLHGDGRMVLLTRAPDLRQARFTSLVDDIRIWTDADGAEPAVTLRDIVDEFGGRGKRLGIEWDAYGLTAQAGRLVDAALDGFCTLEDASDLISRLRLVKSPAELAFVRRAAELADAALTEAETLAEAGAFEGDILAAMHGAVFRGDGDYPGNEFIIGSGPGALLCRYFSGRRHLNANDQLTLEFAGVYRHYHACLMRTILIGEPAPEHGRMHQACRDALAACESTLKPGATMGQVFDAHARVMDEAGMAPHRLNACGYSLGTTFSPNWMDWPMFYTGNPIEVAPNMVFFLHMILMDSDSNRAMTLGRTVVIDEDGCRPLSRASADLVVK